ncbi:hypothetical protein MAMC_01014 [Methylacidimicrobium cyclopophantes]|uniref:Uncharacterized protein n=1 Tax=Methylacidimicrobium cyclopophantes TaxID=1041766 RepID=A0A5E6MA31_9BACT|nr:hypothetical protein [Methylacidimicrobium cyclopophantes]VVM06255.1 hypothetical protein MAMC_01014 [Methylacidimicrobium cyclopophantes]
MKALQTSRIVLGLLLLPLVFGNALSGEPLPGSLPSDAIPQPNLPPGVNEALSNPNGSSKQVVEEDAPPVLVNGRRADELNEDELRNFLQDKVRTIHQGDGQVEMLRIAPGYPLVLEFAEPISGWELGDGKLISVKRSLQSLILRATEDKGDTSLIVFFGGGKTRPYHLFVEESFAKAQTLIRVAPFAKRNGMVQKASWSGGEQPGQYADVAEVAHVVENYDLLVREGSITPRDIQRLALFRRSQMTGFDYYYLYRFASGPLAITFAWRNPFPYPVRLDESTLRVAIGGSRFIPDFVSVNKELLPPKAATSGFLILFDPPFAPEQPFALVWKPR